MEINKLKIDAEKLKKEYLNLKRNEMNQNKEKNDKDNNNNNNNKIIINKYIIYLKNEIWS